MRDYLIFDGINSKDFHVYLSDAKQFEGAQKVYERKKIPGRSGDLVFSDGSYENVDIEYNFYLLGDTVTDLDAFRGALISREGYIRLEDTLRPDEYRMGIMTSPFDIDSSDRKNASFDVTFSCKPQRYLKDGELKHTFTTAGMIQNPTYFASKPLIRAYGTGTLTIGDKSCTISSGSVTDIDSDVMDAYYGTENRNGCFSGDFPVLVPGKNELSFTGFTKIVIVPRWWKI